MYALGEKDQQRFREFLTSVPPERLEGEAALLRVLAERAAQQNQAGLVNALVSTISKIAATAQAVKVKEGVLMERETVLKIAKGLIDLLTDALRQWKVADQEQIIDQLIDSLPGLFERIEHEKRPLCLPSPSPRDDGEGLS